MRFANDRICNPYLEYGDLKSHTVCTNTQKEAVLFLTPVRQTGGKHLNIARGLTMISVVPSAHQLSQTSWRHGTVMSLLPYWLGLRPTTYTSYVRIRGGGRENSPTHSTYRDKSTESERSTTLRFVAREREARKNRRPAYEQALADLDALAELDVPPEDFMA